MVGYTTFGIEHTIFGLVLELALAPRREYSTTLQASTASGHGVGVQSR